MGSWDGGKEEGMGGERGGTGVGREGGGDGVCDLGKEGGGPGLEGSRDIRRRIVINITSKEVGERGEATGSENHALGLGIKEASEDGVGGSLKVGGSRIEVGMGKGITPPGGKAYHFPP